MAQESVKSETKLHPVPSVIYTTMTQYNAPFFSLPLCSIYLLYFSRSRGHEMGQHRIHIRHTHAKVALLSNLSNQIFGVEGAEERRRYSRRPGESKLDMLLKAETKHKKKKKKKSYRANPRKQHQQRKYSL